MTLEGVRKAGIVGSALIAITTLALKAAPEISTVIYFGISAITVIALWGITVQGWLDSKGKGSKETNGKGTETNTV